MNADLTALTNYSSQLAFTMCLWAIFTFSVAHAATEVQVNANAEPKICKQFRLALDSDAVSAMSGNQLCQYSFERKHGTQGYFQRLDWKAVPGDPVALTMKIFDANALPSSLQPPGGDAKRRADALAYAKFQLQQHALFIEIAPFSVTQLTPPATFKEISGYVLRSRGMSCGDSDGNVHGRNELIAFYSDKNLTNPFRIADNIYGDTVEPVKIAGKYYLVDNWYEAAWGGQVNRKGVYFLSINKLHFSFDQKQVFKNTICGFTYTMEDK
jgi:hypothetical protein